MRQYPEVPIWWYVKNQDRYLFNWIILFVYRYGIVFVLVFLTAALICHYGQLMPWYLLFRMLSGFFFVVVELI